MGLANQATAMSERSGEASVTTLMLKLPACDAGGCAASDVVAMPDRDRLCAAGAVRRAVGGRALERRCRRAPCRPSIPAGPSEHIEHSTISSGRLSSTPSTTAANRLSVEDENSRPTSIVNLVVAPTRKNFRSVPPSSKSRVTARLRQPGQKTGSPARYWSSSDADRRLRLRRVPHRGPG